MLNRAYTFILFAGLFFGCAHWLLAHECIDKNEKSEQKPRVNKKVVLRIKITTGAAVLIGFCAYYFFVRNKFEWPKVPFSWGFRKMKKNGGCTEKTEKFFSGQELFHSLPEAQCSLLDEASTLNFDPTLFAQYHGAWAHFDSKLYESVEEQIEVVKSIGIELDMTKSDEVDLCDDTRGDLRLNDLIAQQIAYAKTIGLEPTTTPH